jgi:hypothetical protein
MFVLTVALDVRVLSLRRFVGLRRGEGGVMYDAEGFFSDMMVDVWVERRCEYVSAIVKHG